MGAVGADRWEVEIFGRASHAGGAPERGISATMILAEALAAVRAGGWFGKVEQNGRSGTSNVGPVGGAHGGPAGDATNVVTDYVLVRGESRSHDAKFFREITAAYKAAFDKAAAAVTNSEGKAGRVKFTTRTDYHPFRLKETRPWCSGRWPRSRRRATRPSARRPTAASMPTGWCATASRP